MSEKQLQSTLQELQRALQVTDRIDDETKQLVLQVAQDLQQLVLRSPKLTNDEISPMTQRLEDLVLRFESDHPQLTGIMGRLVDYLAALGI